jgi:hypothetical protein
MSSVMKFTEEHRNAEASLQKYLDKNPHKIQIRNTEIDLIQGQQINISTSVYREMQSRHF